jgi:hypothetical protein
MDLGTDLQTFESFSARSDFLYKKPYMWGMCRQSHLCQSLMAVVYNYGNIILTYRVYYKKKLRQKQCQTCSRGRNKVKVHCPLALLSTQSSNWTNNTRKTETLVVYGVCTGRARLYLVHFSTQFYV